MSWWWLVLACGGGPTAPDEDRPDGAQVEVSALPSMGGAPILAEPVVLGGLAREDVAAAIAAREPAIAGCAGAGEPPRGKVLVRIVVAADGAVRDVGVRATTLRDPELESCLVGVLQATRFAPLVRGETALVTWPFVFPRP